MENPEVATFVASTSQEDRAGDVIDQTGWDLDHYHKNPVVLFSHQWHLPPVGKSLQTWVDPSAEGERLLATIRFAPTDLGRELALLAADGYLRAVSVGFRPIQWEVRRDSRTGAALGAHFLRQELLEISVVSLPANPQALRKRYPELTTAWQAIKWNQREPDESVLGPRRNLLPPPFVTSSPVVERGPAEAESVPPIDFIREFKEALKKEDHDY